VKVAALAVRRAEQRPGFVLNDAQIASIKRRLNLTPDQEEMWPAVEAALRNLAYRTAHATHWRDAAPGRRRLPPPIEQRRSPDLKSAAIPLIMSFNSEQKDEVRNLAHSWAGSARGGILIACLWISASAVREF